MTLSRIVRRCLVSLSIGLASLVAPTAGAAVVLHISGGILTGASGITVGALPGTYSVSFTDGDCASVFGACDSTHFTFTNMDEATAASNALLSLVFTDSGLGNFNAQPALTAGCTLSTSGCDVYTPFAVNGGDVSVMIAENQLSSIGADGVFGYGASGGSLGGVDEFSTWAVWVADAPQTAAPEPGSLALLGLAGMAMMWTQRRRPGARMR